MICYERKSSSQDRFKYSNTSLEKGSTYTSFLLSGVSTIMWFYLFIQSRRPEACEQWWRDYCYGRSWLSDVGICWKSCIRALRWSGTDLILFNGFWTTHSSSKLILAYYNSLHSANTRFRYFVSLGLLSCGILALLVRMLELVLTFDDYEETF